MNTWSKYHISTFHAESRSLLNVRIFYLFIIIRTEPSVKNLLHKAQPLVWLTLKTQLKL